MAASADPSLPGAPGSWRFGMLVAIGLAAHAGSVVVPHAIQRSQTRERQARVRLAVGPRQARAAWAAAFHVMLSLDDHERLAERSAHMAALLGGLPINWIAWRPSMNFGMLWQRLSAFWISRAPSGPNR